MRLIEDLFEILAIGLFLAGIFATAAMVEALRIAGALV